MSSSASCGVMLSSESTLFLHDIMRSPSVGIDSSFLVPLINIVIIVNQKELSSLQFFQTYDEFQINVGQMCPCDLLYFLPHLWHI